MRRGIAAIVLSVATACAAGPRGLPPNGARLGGSAAASAPSDAGPDATADPSAGVPSLEALAVRGAGEVAQMREVLRVDDLGARPAEIGPLATDVCLRAIVAANLAVTARFEDAARAPRGEAGPASGLVPPRGPVCARKGERLRLVVAPADGGAVFARAVVWQAP